MVGGMAVSIGAPSDARTARRLDEHGIQAAATVVDVVIHRRPSADPIAGLELEFEDEFGQAQRTTMNYCGDASRHGIGDEVEIRYDPDDPKITNFVECNYPTDETVALIIGVIAIVIGTLLVLFVWNAWGWRRWWIGIPVAIFGALFAGTSFEEDCACGEAIYISAALVLIGLAAVVGSRFKQAS